jgi:hypothetical protein
VTLNTVLTARRLSRVALILLSSFAASCGLTEPSGPHAAEQTQLQSARRLWRSQGLNDYTYTFSRSCFCVTEYREPATITVRAGAIVSATSVANGRARDLAWYHTVEGLFDLIQTAIDEDAATLRVEYDSTRGYVTSAYIDIDERMADEELSFQARNLTPLR